MLKEFDFELLLCVSILSMAVIEYIKTTYKDKIKNTVALSNGVCFGCGLLALVGKTIILGTFTFTVEYVYNCCIFLLACSLMSQLGYDKIVKVFIQLIKGGK